MVGGFLGAGKTTAILNVAERLREHGMRVGLITNDQSYGLVDTAMLSSHGFAVREITGGCFCCRFNSLVDASQQLTADATPDTFIAEPVGSCTDLKATVDYPLRRMYGEDYAIAPLSVLIDPMRAERILGLESGKSFSSKVLYIYRKQLEEADIIVVNKIDLLEPARLQRLEDELRRQFPNARVVAISARNGAGVDAWIELLQSASPRLHGAMEVDYATYADGEALLGWLNASVQLEARTTPFDGNALLADFGQRLREDLHEKQIEVAHLKMTLAPDDGAGLPDLAVANLVRSEGQMEFSHRLSAEVQAGQLTINLRAEADPDLLRGFVQHAIEAIEQTSPVAASIEHLESFRPGKPTPTHRLAEV